MTVELFSPLGASRAAKATVECFVEVPFKLNGRTIRPDGLIRISYGKAEWVGLVEVKTGSACLNADQINDYWDVARDQGFDYIVTISNQIAPSPDAHPTEGLRVRANSKVGVQHYSWTAILSTAVTVKVHRGVDDVEQSWILGELIRYLEHPASGAMAFDDMGPFWVEVRNGAKDGALHKQDEAVSDIAQRWDQLMRFAALRLGSEIGEDVSLALSKTHKDARARAVYLTESLASTGTMDADLRVPHTVGDLHISADLKARRLTASVNVPAPEDRGGRARCTWILGQLDDVRPGLVVSSYPKNARTPYTATVEALHEDKDILLGPDKKEPARFTLSLTVDMGAGRSTGKKSPGFIDSVLNLVNEFYGTVVQNITPWVPKAPQITRPSPVREPSSPARSDHNPVASPPPVSRQSGPPPWSPPSSTDATF